MEYRTHNPGPYGVHRVIRVEATMAGDEPTDLEMVASDEALSKHPDFVTAGDGQYWELASFEDGEAEYHLISRAR